MSVIYKSLILFGLILTAGFAQAKPFTACIQDTQIKHRMERDESIQACFKTHKAFLGSDNCFNQVRNLREAQQSANLSESLKFICFYEASIFQNIKTCLIRADEFKNADNHDEAVFHCYKQFQDKLTKKECNDTAKKLIYPAKKDYLLQHCANNY